MGDTDERSLDERQSETIEEYLSLRTKAESDPKLKRKCSKLESRLDEIYWERVETLLASRVTPESQALDFADEERLLIDMGYLDARLVKDASEGLQQRLLEELSAQSAPNHFYLSEWLEDRYRRYRLTEDLSVAEDNQDEGGAGATEVSRSRVKTLSRLLPLFQGLPGVNAKMTSFAASGKLDEQILRADIALLDNPDRRLFLYRRRLLSLRSQILSRARARTNETTSLKDFDTLDDIFALDWRERFERHERGENSDHAELEESAVSEVDVSCEKAIRHLVSELHFVKTLMPLGALAGGVTRSRPVMLQEGQRVTKKETARGLELVESCDRGFDVKPVVLIAPFKGRGIFEWDRDSLVVSLTPVDSSEDSVANAAGNRRMLIDSFQNEGAMRSAYEQQFPDENYQQSFQADYRAWVGRIGHGKRDGLSAERRAFFRKWVGPETEGVLAPANLRNLGPQTRAAIEKRIEKQIALSGQSQANLHHRLAVLKWLDGDTESALKEMAVAGKLAPNDGMILFSLGLLLRQMEQKEKSSGVFAACAKRVPDTIWAVYAQDECEGMS